MIVVLERELPELFASTVLPDFPGCKLGGSSFGSQIEVLVDVPGVVFLVPLSVDRPADGLAPLVSCLESLETQLNAFLDSRGLLLADGNTDWN